PVSNQLTIKGATSKVSRLNVYSVLGNAVLSKVIDNQNGDISVNVSALSSGLYIVELNGENGERLTKKIIKQ
ncbi:MAG: T9SS type A sorting domain-containing protein, partial [Polaribacter sp.]